MKPSEFLKLAQTKNSTILSGYSKATQPGADDKSAMEDAKKDVIDALERASAAFFLCNEELPAAIRLAETLENETRQ